MFLVALIAITTYLTIKMGYMYGIIFSLLPAAIVVFVTIIDKPAWTFSILFISNYYVSGLSRYITSISPGIFMDMILIITFIIIIFQLLRHKSEIKFRNAFNILTFLAFIWLAYCTLQLFNPNSSSPVAWFTNVRGIGVYFLAVTALTSILLVDYLDFIKILKVWAVLCLTAVLKALIQKYFGFDFAEQRWLAEGGSTTHIIYSGIRYFSFFTDAANFGTGMGFSLIVFGLAAVYIKRHKLKVFFAFTAIACGYGMIISGTRGSLAVPAVALLLLAFISRNFKIVVSTIIILSFSYIFLNYTYYGHGNSYIRRMRSAFNTQDASYVLRKENQAKLAVYLADKPFGGGIGMSRGKASTYTPDPVLSKIASDSWYVLIWVETGIIGLSLYVILLLIILFRGIYLVLFKLKDPELRGIVTALVCGLAGLYAASYSIEIMGQFPNGFIIFTCMAFIFLSPKYDEEILMRNKLKTTNEDEY